MNTEVEINLALNDRPCAKVLGELMHDLPKDLYIPPHALEIFLERFTGPLDLLLYHIKKENIDILDIPIAQVTEQYMRYVELMKQLHLELASEYLVMAAMLAEIKSRVLLPSSTNIEKEEDDPRAELIRRLHEYERYKKAAEDINILPRMQREIFPISVKLNGIEWQVRPMPKFSLQELFVVFKDVMARVRLYRQYYVRRENLSVRERMTQILTKLQTQKFVTFEKMFSVNEGRLGVVITFVAILELLRQNLLDIAQMEIYGAIYLKSVEAGDFQCQN